MLGSTAVAVGAGALAANKLDYIRPAKAATGSSAVAPGDLDDYYGDRALRGSLLPKGWRKVERLTGVE